MVERIARAVRRFAPAAILAASVLALLIMRASDWRGDEYTYSAMARAVGEWLRGSVSGRQAMQAIFGTGWFMPGIALIGAPPFVLTDDPPHWLQRGWLLAINLGLTALLIRRFARQFGPRHAALAMLFPGLAAGWYFSALSWFPEITAGLLSTLALLAGWRCAVRISRGSLPEWQDVAAMEVCLIAALYLRGPALLLALALNGFLILLAVLAMRGALPRLAAGCLAIALALAPWSIAASRHFDATVITTTNVPLVLADGFGDPARTCFGRCPAGRDIWPAWQFAQGRAAQTGENPLVVERRMMRASLSGLSPRTYLRTVRANFARFLFEPSHVARLFEPVMHGVPPGMRAGLLAFVALATWLLYAPMLAALLLANVARLRGGDGQRLQSLLIKLGTAAAFAQPFVHKSSGRYWVAFAPLMAWSAALLIAAWRDRPGHRRHSAVAGVLDAAQTTYAAAFALAALVLLAA
ncbi:hypothetical protein [Aurantiacibacter spongiae]|uniref:Glycosyltransferase RgtA/B/C/D-like domain-containing protein n=1 Tax=Aurantiacibacter spongiae TaxID=2488860 RepID=A0A3N5DL95_9SPHN|nr:hypothetical protein [Aurantiacibacter spongiae]RPF71545.1 hypothetical protein EG799_07880 [Aurantiacibacter spongiae]